MMNHLNAVKVFAPATCANVAVGFDILGFAIKNLSDELTLVKSDKKNVDIVSIESTDKIPYDVKKNTATIAMLAMMDYLNLEQGFDLSIKKNIPVSSGLGGSAACSVAAVVALNHLLKHPLDREQLIEFALVGEHATSGAKHGDNIIPCLYGGMTLIQSLTPTRIISLPLIPLYVVFVHPHQQLDTRQSRAAIEQKINLSSFVNQSINLASFISALYEKNYDRLEQACKDELIEPMRAHLIPGFYDVKATAYRYGALACSISGSGPTIFALVKTKQQSIQIAKKMVLKFNKLGIQCDSFITTISTQGAKIIYEQ